MITMQLKEEENSYKITTVNLGDSLVTIRRKDGSLKTLGFSNNL